MNSHLAILFVDLSHSTHLSSVMEAEIYAELMHDMRQACRAAVEAHQGTINQFQGDGLQALFGYPRASEDDGLRAAEAALEMHTRVRALRAKYAAHGGADLSVHSGLHAGKVFAWPGDEIAGRLDLSGPAPGVAKHLSDIAGEDELLAADARRIKFGHEGNAHGYAKP